MPAIVITGASAGIGAAIAREFAHRAHYTLVLMARRKDRLEALQAELGKERTRLVVLDVTSRSDVESAFASIENSLGGIDILVNNAGGAFGLDPAYKADLDDWEQCIDVNINGLVYCTHAVLPGMVKRNRGHIINLGSIAGTYPYPGGNVYGGTKAFVHQFSLGLRADLIGTRVRVTCIEPGLLGNTEFSLVRFGGDQEKAAKVYEGTEPLHPDDIAKAVAFCAELPEHVNINTMEIMPVAQAWGAFAVDRKGRQP